jgi:uncharacterized protein (TIGR02466 family)
MINSELQNLFTIPVYKVDLLSINNERIKDYVYQLKNKDKGRILSNVGGWQSTNLNLKAKETKELFNEIVNCANDYKDALGFNKSSKIKMLNSWFNINEYKDYNSNHSHPHSLISGVYYIHTNKDSGNIVFSHPAYEIMQYDWQYFKKDNINSYSASSWWLPAKNHKLYLFPSWLLHKVEPNLSKDSRISLSFNLDI